jgi:D-alanyl-D-alanine carboxypeptidase
MRKSLRGRRVVACGTLVALLAATTAAPALATTSPLQGALDTLTAQDGVPGAEAVVQDGSRTRVVRSGRGDVTTGKPFPRNGSFRAGSVTKTFVATVVLQLVAEGRVKLDAPVERYLPGLLPDKRITVRQLLQHTSGLPNYTEYLGVENFEDVQHEFFQPHDLLAAALAHPAKFAPGTKWDYSNTNYLLAGLLIEHVTGRPVQEQITKRVIEKAGLRDTYWPQPGDETIQGPHPHGYALANSTGTKVVDATEMDPSWGGAAGQLISTPSDLARLSRALLGGKLLPPAQLAEMRKTVDAPLFPGWQYGLGLFRVPLSCGGVYWGHGGDIDGYETRGGATEDGRSVGLAVTALPGTFGDGEKAAKAVLSAVDTAFCR